MKSLRAVCAVTLIVLGLGCAEEELFQAYRVEKQHQAGSVHFAVVSVAPWNEYVEDLQPRFELEESDALNMVVPSTRALEESVLNAVQGAVGVSSDVEQKGSRKESTRSGTEADGTEVTESSVEESSTPDPRDVLPRASFVQVGERVRGAPERSVLDENVTNQMDPVLRYNTATALMQEVALLNRYVRDAAIRRGFDPFVVRLQITLMPYARNEPYDAYSTISFFTTRDRDDRGEDRSGTPDTMLRGDAGAPVAARKMTPQIVPLMATDNLEATSHSRTVENIRQMAGALFFMGGGITGSGEVQQFTKNLQGVLGRDLNSLLTVARLSDNTLRVRLGAMQQAASNYSMVPRNHYITVLVMVPRAAAASIEVVAKTTMMDAETGKELADRSEQEIEASLTDLSNRYGLEDVPRSDLRALLSYAQANDQAGYFSTADRVLKRTGARRIATSLWLDLVTLMVGSQYAATEFDLPLGAAFEDGERFDPSELRALLLDDGKDRCSVTIPARAGIELERASIELVVGGQGGPFPFQPIELGYLPPRDDVLLVFPSLKAWGISDPLALSEIRLVVEQKGERMEIPLSYLAKPAAPAPPPKAEKK